LRSPQKNCFFASANEIRTSDCPYNKAGAFVFIPVVRLYLMEKPVAPKRRSKQGRYVVAAVLGTALSALGSAPSLGAEPSAAAAQSVNDISRYCTVCWRNARLDPNCWNDCTQEVLCRLLKRVGPEDWSQMLKVEGEQRREFLRAIDAVKKRTQRARRWSNNAVDAVADRHERHERQLADDREAVQDAAGKLLSPRQQRILQMSFEGWSVQDIAAELQVPAERVSDEKYKAIRKLRGHFCSPEQARYS
jgi:RNA polymerase sigma factor (sigma-70 family)